MLPERPWKLDAVVRLLMLVLMSLSSSMLLMILAGKTLGKALATTDYEFTTQVVGVLGGQGLGLVWMWRFLREHQVTWAEAFGFRRAPLRSLGLGCGAMLVALPVALVVIGTVVALLLKLFGVTPEPQVTIAFLKRHPSSWQLAVLGFLAVVLVPIAEEMFFRGVLYTTIKQRGYPRVAFWGTAILFGAIHFNLAALLPLIFLALVFTWLYERTGNLLAPIAAHVMFNAVNFIALVVNLPEWLEKSLNQ